MLNRDSINSTTVSRRVSMATFIGGLGGGLVFPILPALGVQLGITGAMIGIILSAPRVARLVSAPWAGRLVDRIGGKIPLSSGLLVEGLGVLCYQGALLWGYPVWWFLVGRTLFGFGSALVLVSAQSMVLHLSNTTDRGRSTARIRLSISLGFPSGLVLGGLIAERFSDSAAFLSGACLTAMGALGVLLLIPSKPYEPPSTVHPGGTLPDKLFPGLFRRPEFPFLAAAWGFNMLVFLSVQGTLLATMVLLVDQRQFHLIGMAAKGTAGLVMGIMMGCSAVQAYLVGRALDRFSQRTTILIPSIIGLTAGFIILGSAQTLPVALVGAVLTGLSFNGISIPALALLGDVTESERYGWAVSRYQLFGDIGGSLGPIVGLEAGLKFGLFPTYLGIASILALSLPAAFLILRREIAWRKSTT